MAPTAYRARGLGAVAAVTITAATFSGVTSMVLELPSYALR